MPDEPVLKIDNAGADDVAELLTTVGAFADQRCFRSFLEENGVVACSPVSQRTG